MLEWLGEKYADVKCLKAANAIENAVVATLRSGDTVPDLGGKATTVSMAEAIAAAVAKGKS
jgi:isocitrate/isopropylmalate dehydrogenase